MAQDKTYQGAIRRKQDNNVLEVGSTGTLDVFGTITVRSSGTFTLPDNVTSLANTKILIGSAAGKAAAQTISGDATLSAAGALTIGNDKIAAAELGVTAGTVTASKAVVPDASKDVTGYRNITQTGYHAGPVQAVTATTTGYSAVVNNIGISTIATTSARKTVKFKLAAPVAGIEKKIIALTTGSTGELGTIAPSTAGVTFNATGLRKITLPSKDDFVVLAGLSATRWAVVSKSSTNVVLAAT